MFRFTRKPSSGSYSQYLAKILHTWLKVDTYRALCEGIPSHSARYTRLTGHNMQP